MPVARSCCIVLLLVALTVGSASAASQDVTSARAGLEQVRRRIEQTLDNLQQTKASEASLVDDLAELNRQLHQARRRVDTLNDAVAQGEQHLATLQTAILENQRQISRMQAAVEKRLVALYKEGDTGPLRVLFSRTTPTEMAWQYEYLTRIVSHDRQLLSDYRQRLAERRTLLADQQGAIARQKATLAEVQGQKALLEEARATRERLLKRARRDQGVLQRLLASLEQQSQQVQELVKRLESEKTRAYTQDTGVFVEQKGHLSWPVPGELAIGFGRQTHPELGTLFDSRGFEVKADRNAPVKAVWSGQVVFADWFHGYGNLVIVDHGGGFHSLYARLGTMNKRRGERVEKGESLGLTDAETGRLYFEIRQNGAPTDPLCPSARFAPPGPCS
jgi:septal ring factor EnvC (AmiA/AmiB activator)